MKSARLPLYLTVVFEVLASHRLVLYVIDYIFHGGILWHPLLPLAKSIESNIL